MPWRLSMQLRLKPLIFGGFLTLLAGCGVAPEEVQGEELGQAVEELKAGAAARGTDQGTSLTATAAATAISCISEEAAQVDIAGALTTTGSVDSVIITAAINGGAPQQMGLIRPQDFSHEGRTKTAGYALSLALPNGEHSIQV